jgi:hypothetical protein
MSMAILELTSVQEYFGQLVINRLHYVSTGTPAAVTLSFALMSAAGFIPPVGNPDSFPTDTLADAIRQLQSSALKYISTVTRDLYSVTDFYEVPYATAIVGGRTGAPASPAFAYGARSNRVRTDIRRGMKRFAGVTEEMMGDGGVLTTTAQGSLEFTCAALSDVLSYDDEGNTITFAPAILGLVEYTTPSGKRAYRIHPTVSAQLSNTATGVVWQGYDTVRTQVSRQYGRGV